MQISGPNDDILLIVYKPEKILDLYYYFII